VIDLPTPAPTVQPHGSVSNTGDSEHESARYQHNKNLDLLGMCCILQFLIWNWWDGRVALRHGKLRPIALMHRQRAMKCMIQTQKCMLGGKPRGNAVLMLVSRKRVPSSGGRHGGSDEDGFNGN
jgi:hypothetical protein